MFRTSVFLLWLCSLAAASAQPAQQSGSLQDTVQVDVLLDSMNAWTVSGELDKALKVVPELKALIKGIPTTRDPRTMMLREMQVSKLEGMAYSYSGHYPEALRAFQEMQRVAELLNSPSHIGAALTYQANQFRELYELDKARVLSQRAISMLRTIPPGEELANALMGMAGIDSDEYLVDSAVIHQRQAIAIYKKTGDDGHLGAALLNQSMFCIQLGRNDSAWAYVQQAEPLVLAGGNAHRLMMLHGLGGLALFRLKKYDAASRELAIADSMATAFEDDESIGRIRDIQALIAARKDDPVKAQALLQSGREALIRDLDLTKVAELTEVRMQAEHAQKAILAAEKLEAQTRQKRSIMVVGAFVLAIAGLLLWMLIHSRRTSARLNAQNETIKRTQGLLVEAERHHAEEQMRTRIARDIHDEIGHGLTKIGLLGARARDSMANAAPELRSTVENMVVQSREVTAALGDIVWVVDPQQDTSTELVEHARSVAARAFGQSDTELDAHFSHHGRPAQVSTDMKHNVMLILKEALNNALKYAGAGRIAVHFQVNDGRYMLRVADDGKGFDQEAVSGENHGLRNMRARAQHIGAVLELRSMPGEGTVVEAQGVLA